MSMLVIFLMMTLAKPAISCSENCCGKVKPAHQDFISCRINYYGPDGGYIVSDDFKGFVISDIVLPGFHDLANNNPQKAFTFWEGLAQRGVVAAQSNTVLSYFLGGGVRKSYRMALYWMRKSKSSKSLWISLNAQVIRIEQTILKDLNFYKGPVDGDFGPESGLAFRKAKKHFNLEGPVEKIVDDLAVIADRQIDNNDPIANNRDANEILNAASGTDFYISNKGHVITNHHLINGCREVKVHAEGRSSTATILAKDKANDLALLKVSNKPPHILL